jgi:hypothetical protein
MYQIIQNLQLNQLNFINIVLFSGQLKIYFIKLIKTIYIILKSLLIITIYRILL